MKEEALDHLRKVCIARDDEIEILTEDREQKDKEI
ncbi:hypothetical protein LCGC14_1255610 [marine sediment metagenome]|uniref:Uncharacterized protein n=1 Tax=marine sediment metagenome TaxID=412755 RepID=A0A0F9L4Z1_9ZZZZ